MMESIMANPEHLKFLKEKWLFKSFKRSDSWYRWRQEHRDIVPDLRDAFLFRRDLRNKNFAGADLRGANLVGAILSWADFRKADLRGALCNSADFFRADLTDVVLTGADMTQVNFSGCILNGTNFEGTLLGGTTFGDNDLLSAKGLESAAHLLPSTLGMDTLRKCKGKLPRDFLRGCGLTDFEIEAVKLHNRHLTSTEVSRVLRDVADAYVGRLFQYHSCFISYSSKNCEFTERLYADLQSKGVRCWFAPKDLKIGDPFRKRIDDAIRTHDKLLIVLSSDSVSSSWVEKEVETAFEKERQQNRIVLFPIRLDVAVMETQEVWAADIRRTRHIGDFSAWKDYDLYKKAFDRLIQDLKA